MKHSRKQKPAGRSTIAVHGGSEHKAANMSVSKGARVTKGQVIGTVGATDPSLPAHLHFEIRHGGPAVDPLDWLRAH